MTDTPPPQETREVDTGEHLQRSVAASAADIAMTLAADPTTYVVGGVAWKAIDAVKDIIVAKTEAQATVEKARIENGYPEQGGAHRDA